MSDLVTFLRARLDEDEQQLRLAAGATSGATLTWGGITVWSFDAALAEVEAKRRIVDLHTGEHECPAQENAGRSGSSRTVLVAPGYIYADDPTLRMLVLPYAEHPECHPSWLPPVPDRT